MLLLNRSTGSGRNNPVPTDQPCLAVRKKGLRTMVAGRRVPRLTFGARLMPEPLADQVVRKISEAAGLYHRLILLVVPSGGGKTAALRTVSERTGGTLINLNLELSRRMLDLTESARILRAPKLLRELVNEAPSDVVLFDNTEILFDISLKQDPLRLLQGVSRNKTVAAAWNGAVIDRRLVYAEPGHPEYRRYPITDLMLVCPEAAE
jgi:hypothetical protein